MNYEPLEAITSLHDAVAQKSFATEELKISRGDFKDAAQKSENHLHGEIFVGGQEHFYLETQASFARVNSEGDLDVWSSTQHPTETQEIVARVLGRTKADVTCVSLRICLLYTSPSPRDATLSRMPSSA